MSPAELHEAVRLQNVHAFIAEAGIFADLQSQGLAEQLAAYRSADATDPAYGGVRHLAAAEPDRHLDAVAFLSRTTFNTYIAPTPLERLEAGEGDAAVVAWCELEKLADRDSLQNTFE